MGDEVEALVLQKEDKEGRLILSKKRAQYERAWGTIEKVKEEDGVVTGTVIEVVKGGLILDIGLRGFLPASLVEMRRVRDLQPYVGKEIEAKIIELDKNRNNVVLSRRAWLEQTQSEVRTTFLKKLQKGQVRSGVVSSHRQLRCVRGPGRRRRPGARLRAVLEAHRPPVRGRRGRPGGHRRGSRGRPGPRARLPVAEGDAGGPVAALRPHPRDRPGRPGQGHQARPVRRVRSRRRRHRGPGPHLRAGRAPRGAAGAGRLVGDEIFVKVIDIDLERRRISLSLKQANEGARPVTEFDPALYGMAAEYDEAGNYKYPEGFDPETNEWLEGYETQREKWEQQYAEAHARWEAHKKQVEAGGQGRRRGCGQPRGCDVLLLRLALASSSSSTGGSSSSSAAVPAVPGPAARWPPTRRWLRCARSSPAAEHHPYDVTPLLAACSSHEGPDLAGPGLRASRCTAGPGAAPAVRRGHGRGEGRGGARAGGRGDRACVAGWAAWHAPSQPTSPSTATSCWTSSGPATRWSLSRTGADGSPQASPGHRRRRRAGPHRHLDLSRAGQDGQRRAATRRSASSCCPTTSAAPGCRSTATRGARPARRRSSRWSTTSARSPASTPTGTSTAQAMRDQGKCLLRVTPTRWGPVATGGFPARLA